ncbi:MAG TPA: pirin family protein [Ignavibacteria bacterium]|jgi:hypothetical protein
MTAINKIINSSKEQIMPGKFINSPFPTDELMQVDPFVLLHHFGPYKVSKSSSFSFEPHPHRGFEAVTFLFEGEFEHKDSTGGFGRLSSGDVQWMTAGSGIIHVEKQPEEFLEKGGVIHGIQLWVNLPKSAKDTEPKYQDIKNTDIPKVEENGNILRVIGGEYNGVKGPAKTFTPIMAIHGILKNENDIKITIPPSYNSLIYITRGEVKAEETIVSETNMVLLNRGTSSVKVKAQGQAEFLLLAGEPINEPVVQYGPFVMNNMAEIKKAFLDYSNGLMGKIN